MSSAGIRIGATADSRGNVARSADRGSLRHRITATWRLAHQRVSWSAADRSPAAAEEEVAQAIDHLGWSDR